MINVICFGKIKEKYLTELINDYSSRIQKYHKINIMELNAENDLDKEFYNLDKHLNKKSFVICLDSHGSKINSVELANLIDKTFINYSEITFIIGSSEGLSNNIKEKANMLLSFSDFTIPHGLFRGVLLEQIYRSFKIINHETYHK